MENLGEHDWAYTDWEDYNYELHSYIILGVPFNVLDDLLIHLEYHSQG